MYSTGDFIPSAQQFNASDWGPTTAQFMDYIDHDLTKKHWDSIFLALGSYSAQIMKEEAMHNGVPEELQERVPLPPSDPPSPPRDV
jgi:hypothetical protein